MILLRVLKLFSLKEHTVSKLLWDTTSRSGAETPAEFQNDYKFAQTFPLLAR